VPAPPTDTPTTPTLPPPAAPSAPPLAASPVPPPAVPPEEAPTGDDGKPCPEASSNGQGGRHGNHEPQGKACGHNE
jgi:hypothetical protein